MKVVQLHERTQNSFEPHIEPKNSLLGPKKDKNDPKIIKSKVRIEENIENRSCLTTLVASNKDFEPYPDPKYSPLEPKKVKNKPKIKSKSNIRIEGNKENKS